MERIEKERLEQERLEIERIERERKEKEKIEKERLEMERLEKEEIKENNENDKREINEVKEENVEKEEIKEEKVEIGEIKVEKEIKIDNLKIRDINPYFSEVYNQKVIPCYKEDKNSCKEKNEFDFENEDHYSGIQLDENDKNYKTYYQIDKSSESQLVKSYISIKSSLTSNSDFDDLSKEYLSYIISNKFENDEITFT